MKNEDDDITNKRLSVDPEENLRIENELQRLKIQAEHGGQSHSTGSLPPDLENEFLKHVMAFEQNYANAKQVLIYDFIGRPEFTKADELDDSSLAPALLRVTGQLGLKNIVVHFDDEVDKRTRYKFITEELFEKETDDFMIPGMTVNFDYEEFHPNHQKDIIEKSERFISGWFKKAFNENSFELADYFVLPDRRMMSRKDMVAHLHHIFDAFKAFKDDKYRITEAKFQLNDNGGLGHAEGVIKYTATLESGEDIEFNGPFKLYMSYDDQYWGIFHIVFPGFTY